MENFLYFFLLVLVFMNTLAFALMWLDKQRSRKGMERAPEVYFFLWAAMFASLGVFLGIFAFRHKTRKIYFQVGIGLLLTQQLIFLMLMYKFFM